MKRVGRLHGLVLVDGFRARCVLAGQRIDRGNLLGGDGDQSNVGGTERVGPDLAVRAAGRERLGRGRRAEQLPDLRAGETFGEFGGSGNSRRARGPRDVGGSGRIRTTGTRSQQRRGETASGDFDGDDECIHGGQ